MTLRGCRRPGWSSPLSLLRGARCGRWLRRAVRADEHAGKLAVQRQADRMRGGSAGEPGRGREPASGVLRRPVGTRRAAHAACGACRRRSGKANVEPEPEIEHLDPPRCPRSSRVYPHACDSRRMARISQRIVSSARPSGALRCGGRLCQFRLTNQGCQSKLTGMDIEKLSVDVSSDDPAIGLRASLALHRLAERVEANHVASAREKGWSWQQIGDALGVTRQSVHTKYNRESS